MAILDDLVSHWTLDEESGNRADAHGSNTMVDRNTVLFAEGKVGNAGLFIAGQSEYLDVADNAELSIGDNDFSASCWFYPLNLINGQGIFGKQGAVAANREWTIKVTDSPTFRAVLEWANAHSIKNTNVQILNAAWFHAVATYDASADDLSLSINGSASKMTNASATTVGKDGATAMEIGRTEAGNYFWGRIDECSFWKGRVISDAEIDLLYNGGSGLAYPWGGGDPAPSSRNRSKRHLLGMM